MVSDGDLQSNYFERLMQLRQEKKEILQGYEDACAQAEVEQAGDLFFALRETVLELRGKPLTPSRRIKFYASFELWSKTVTRGSTGLFVIL